jgi:uncharacterized protein (DUF1330 family)
MAGYLIVIIKAISDIEALQEYRNKAWPSIEKFGGKPLISARSRCEYLEGEPAMAVVAYRFPSFEQARCWHDSPEYRDAVRISGDGIDLDMILADGVD